MASHTITATAHIAAPAALVYSIFADYHDAHPRILPNPPFVALVVEQGGYGAGTVFQLHTRLYGLQQTLRAVVTEPEPGRVLVETYPDQGMITSFIVEAREGNKAAEVTITTVLPPRPRVVGAIEGWLFRRLLLPVYHKELAHVAAWAARVQREQRPQAVQQ